MPILKRPRYNNFEANLIFLWKYEDSQASMMNCYLLLILHLTCFSTALRLPPSPNLHLALLNSPLDLSSQSTTDDPTPGNWPLTPNGRLEPPYDYGSQIYLTINSYGLPLARRDFHSNRTIIAYLGLLLHELEKAGEASDILSYTEVDKGVVVLKYYPWEILGTWGLRRCELVLFLETIGGLAIVKGPRRIQSSYVVRDGREVGRLILGISQTRIPNVAKGVTG